MTGALPIKTTVRPVLIETILEGHAHVSLQHYTHPFFLAQHVRGCAAEGHDVIRVTRTQPDHPAESHWTAIYRIDAGTHDGLTIESATQVCGLELILPECSRDGLGEVVLALTRGNTIYAPEVLCIKPRDVKERREEAYGVFVRKGYQI